MFPEDGSIAGGADPVKFTSSEKGWSDWRSIFPSIISDLGRESYKRAVKFTAHELRSTCEECPVLFPTG
jgi:hypothetical protein